MIFDFQADSQLIAKINQYSTMSTFVFKMIINLVKWFTSVLYKIKIIYTLDIYMKISLICWVWN